MSKELEVIESYQEVKSICLSCGVKKDCEVCLDFSDGVEEFRLAVCRECATSGTGELVERMKEQAKERRFISQKDKV